MGQDMFSGLQTVKQHGYHWSSTFDRDDDALVATADMIIL